MTTVLGFVGLGVDLGVAYVARRSAENAADSAAFTGAVAVMAQAPDAVKQAQAIAASYGFSDSKDGVLVTVNTPPSAGAYSGETKAVEVIVRRPGRRFFSGFFVTGSTLIRARAVARAGQVGNGCVVALHETASASALETGSADVNLAGCSLYANSISPTAFELKGAANITADSVGVVGGYSVSNNATLVASNGVHTGQKPVADPYKDVPIPAYSGCNYNGAAFGGSQTISNNGVTVFCNGLKINAGAVVTLSPGVYVVDRGAFSVNGAATLKGNGVTIVLTSSSGSDYATLQINGGASVNLAAPASGPTQGLVFYQDRKAPGGVDNKINGGATQTISGAIYFPSQGVSFTGGATSTSGCTQLLASQVAFQGNSTLGIDCAGTGVKIIGGVATALVE